MDSSLIQSITDGISEMFRSMDEVRKCQPVPFSVLPHKQAPSFVSSPALPVSGEDAAVDVGDAARRVRRAVAQAVDPQATACRPKVLGEAAGDKAGGTLLVVSHKCGSEDYRGSRGVSLIPSPGSRGGVPQPLPTTPTTPNRLMPVTWIVRHTAPPAPPKSLRPQLEVDRVPF